MSKIVRMQLWSNIKIKLFLLKIIPNVKVSDTTKDAICTSAGLITLSSHQKKL